MFGAIRASRYKNSDARSKTSVPGYTCIKGLNLIFSLGANRACTEVQKSRCPAEHLCASGTSWGTIVSVGWGVKNERKTKNAQNRNFICKESAKNVGDKLQSWFYIPRADFKWYILPWGLCIEVRKTGNSMHADQNSECRKSVQKASMVWASLRKWYKYCIGR